MRAVLMSNVSQRAEVLDIATGEEDMRGSKQSGFVVYCCFKLLGKDMNMIGALDKGALNAQAFFYQPLVGQCREGHVGHDDFVRLVVVQGGSNRAEGSGDAGSNCDLVGLRTNDGCKFVAHTGNLTQPDFVPRVRAPLVPKFHELRYALH